MNLYKYKDIVMSYLIGSVLRDCKTVLDVGCGDNSPLQDVPGSFKSEGLDIYKKSIDISKKKHIHDSYKLGDIRDIHKIYKKNAFDAVIAFDVIEHFQKKEALTILKKIEKIAKSKVIILTPHGFLPQGKLYGNEYQEHKSGWEIEEFKRMGYTVYGLRGFKSLRDNSVSPRWKPKFFWGIIIVISELMFIKFPSLSFHLLAVKEK